MPAAPTGQRGQSMVEFALVLPIWLTVIAVVFMIAWLAFLQIALERAATEGVKAGSIFRDDRLAEQRTREAFMGGPKEGDTGVNLEEVIVTCVKDGAPADLTCRPDEVVNNLVFPNRLRVRARYTWTAPFSPGAVYLIGLPIEFVLEATAVASLEPGPAAAPQSTTTPQDSPTATPTP
jgi:hypothetical protein